MTADSPSLLSIVIPAHNEAGILKAALDRIKSTLDQAGLNSEIIVVDDGSTDETFNLVARLAGTVQGLKGIIRILKC